MKEPLDDLLERLEAATLPQLVDMALAADESTMWFMLGWLTRALGPPRWITPYDGDAASARQKLRELRETL